MNILKGHLSAETAFIVNDYPYGFRLRCSIRYWLEDHPKHGVRLWSQTTNPKKSGEVWNKAKASTYCSIAGAMFIDDNGHVKWNGVSNYDGHDESLAFKNIYLEGIPPNALERLDEWIHAKRIYEDKLNAGIDWKTAGRETAMQIMKERIEKIQADKASETLL